MQTIFHPPKEVVIFHEKALSESLRKTDHLHAHPSKVTNSPNVTLLIKSYIQNHMNHCLVKTPKSPELSQKLRQDEIDTRLSSHHDF